MRRRVVVAVLFLTTFLSQMADADQPHADGMLTLAQAVQRVANAGFDVRAARGDAEMAQADARSARASLLPQIGISGNVQDANEPQLGMPVARQTYASASLTLPLLVPALWNSSRAAWATADSATASVDESAGGAVFATVQAYRRAQLADAVLEARHLAVRDQEEHLRLGELRVAAGKAPRYVVARDRAALAMTVQNEEDAASERDQARNDLAALLDLPAGPALAIEPLAQAQFSEAREKLLARALLQRPALTGAEDQMMAAQARLAAARAAFLPTAQVTAQTYNGSSSPDLGHSGGQFLISATLPLLDGGSRSADVLHAQGALDRATAVRDQLRAYVERDVVDAYREFEAARRNLTTAQAAQDDAEEQLRIARVREAVGRGVELETLDALSVGASGRETVLRALARYDVAIAAIQHAAGDRTP